MTLIDYLMAECPDLGVELNELNALINEGRDEEDPRVFFICQHLARILQERGIIDKFFMLTKANTN